MGSIAIEAEGVRSAGDPPVAPLQVAHADFSYGRRAKALDDVSFVVSPSSFTAVLGPNGAGKTTLMALITRLFVGPTGKITVAGHDLAQAPRQALAAMGVVFQRPTLDLELSVEANLRYAGRLYGLDRQRLAARIGDVLARLELEPQRRASVRSLSGGMRRRVELARALLHEPQLLVLDEPTVGLDVDSRQKLVAHVHALCAEAGRAVLWTTHLLDEIWPGDQVVVLHRGRVLATGQPGELARSTGTADLAAAFAALTGKPAEGMA